MKKKNQTVYVCENCGYENIKWFMKCPECSEYDSAVIFTLKNQNDKTNDEKVEISFLEDIFDIPERLKLNFDEVNKILNGGIVKGAIYLLSGEPGIGKSTLVSQFISNHKELSLYISGEESKEQVMQRFYRLNIKNKNIGFVFENNLEKIIKTVNNLKQKPSIILIDSIQTIKSEDFNSLSGSVSQIKECAKKLTDYAKKNNISIILIGHVNKEGIIAGPKLLEHIVDCVINFELEKSSGLRMLRILKNRFGSTDEIVLFEMKEKGLFPVENISEYFISDYSNEPGNVLTIVKEGNKLIPIEIQSLVSKPVYSSPRLITTGTPSDRTIMINAVLSKKAKIPIENKDIFINTSGGFKTKDSSLDLAIAFSLVSSFLDKPFKGPLITFGEIGLDGKIRNVSLMEKRIELAKNIGIKNIVVPDNNYISKDIIKIYKVTEIINLFRGN